MNNKEKDIDIFKNNLPVGKLRVCELTKDENVNFFSYIYADYCLKTVFALDLSVKDKY